MTDSVAIATIVIVVGGLIRRVNTKSPICWRRSELALDRLADDGWPDH